MRKSEQPSSSDAPCVEPGVATKSRLTYRGYLQLPTLLACQSPRSAVHDEMLFVTIHQASELWLKLCLHELDEARVRLAANEIQPALKMMARVSRIQAQLIQSWDVLATMTPSDYQAMRGALGTSSGFQSDQYRRLEFVMGNRDPAMIAQFGDEPAIVTSLESEILRPSLYDEALELLSRRGLPIPHDLQGKVTKGPRQTSPQVLECWRIVYSDPEAHWDLYELAEKLVDLEYHFQLWRFGHLKTVERVIGFKSGTGGTAGVPYLARVVEQRFFPELLDVRTSL